MSLAETFASLHALELTDAEVSTVLERALRPHRKRWRSVAVVLAGIGAACALALAVPAGRAGLSDAIERFLAGGPPPGDALPAGERPAWVDTLEAGGSGAVRVLARSGDERLLAYRTKSGHVCFDFGGHVGMCWPPGYEDPLGGDTVFVFGPTHRDPAGRWILWGVTLDAVERVELRYSDARPTSVAATNGFVLRSAAGGHPTELVAIGANGEPITTVDVHWRFEHAPVGP